MQFSLFGAEAVPPSMADLDGLLLAGAEFVHAESTARLSVVLAEAWRAQAVLAALGNLGVAAAQVAAPGGLLAVQSEFASALLVPARRWRRGAITQVPADLELTAQGLRLWVTASGRRDDAGYLLGVADSDDLRRHAAGAQLARLGIAGIEVGVRGRSGWRITSQRRLRRLAELAGAAPEGAAGSWPEVQ